MINLEWLRSFRAIYETGSLTAAAQLLYISQPGVSLHLNSLEAHIGKKLFDRGNRKMLATEQGKILYISIREAMEKLEKVEQRFSKNNNSNKACLHIGMCFETFQLILEPYIHSFDFDLITKFGDYSEMLSDLDKGLLDFIISPYKDDHLNLNYEIFSTEKMILVAGNQSDSNTFYQLLEKGNRKELELWLIQQPWYGTTGDMESMRLFWQQNFKKNPEFKPNYIVPNKSSIIRCLSNTNGWAIVPDFLAQKQIQEASIHQIWSGDTPLENTLYFVERKKTIYTQAIQQMKEIFKKEMQPITITS